MEQQVPTCSYRSSRGWHQARIHTVRAREMARYYFQLRDGHGGLNEPEPCDLPDDEAALAYARAVATEVMKNRERDTRHWRIGIRREREADCFTELQFAATDGTLNHLVGSLRELV